MQKKKFSMVVRGGEVDPANKLARNLDIGVSLPNIAELIDPMTEDRIDCTEAVDATGCLVVPGLVEFHGHLFPGGFDIGVEPDELIKLGAVAGVDCGSTGFAGESDAAADGRRGGDDRRRRQ
jgi:dihydroorotase